MAVRVRKLARQLKRTPAEVLGLLHAIGYSRYRSSEDMVSDAAVAKAREAVRKGVRAAPVTPEGVRKAPKKASSGPGRSDLMAQLVPGVVRQGQPPRPASKPKPPPKPSATPPRAEAPAAPPRVDRSEIEAAHAEIRVLKEQNAALRSDLAARDAQITELSAAPDEPSGLEAALQARGLLGQDEHARALAGLAQARLLDPALLSVADASAFGRLLTDRLVLFGGDVPDALTGVVGVSVALDRADMPGASALARLGEKVGEQLMLHGLRRVRAIGVPPRWHGMLRSGIDTRIELSIEPGGERDEARARRDALGADVVWLWGVGGDDGARDAWSQAPLLVDGPTDLHGALLALVEGLEAR